jgi:hypothetical protein
MTETERIEGFNEYEPIFGKPGIRWYQVLLYRLGTLFFVDLPSKATIFVIVVTWMAWRLLDKGKLVSDVAVIAVVGLMALAWLNFCMRKYVGPLLEAIATLIASWKSGPKPISPPPPK